MSPLERSMNDRTAEDYYAQLMLNSVREGNDPNDSDEEQEFEGYAVPHWDAKTAQHRLVEIRSQLKEQLEERQAALKALRNNPAHKKLSAFERVTAEAEMWTGQRSGQRGQGGKGAKKGGTHRMNNQLVEAIDQEDERSQHTQAESERLTSTPHYIKGTLRRYQLDGVSWLLQLADRGINGILADEMGLGKTFQTISLLSYLKYTRGLPGPHLVVAPKSVLGNWFREIKKWCPTLLAYKFHGSSDIRPMLVKTHLKPPLKYDIVLTTFEMVITEVAAFKKIHWRYLIVDEAHKLKNNETVAHQTLDSLSTDHRLLVTGTPLQNDLKELWALLHFLIPDLFDESEHFVKWFDSRTGEQETTAVEQMHLMLAPLMLRRLKSEAATELPPKKEIYVGCKLSKKQRDWYVSVLAKDSEAINRAATGSGGTRERLSNIVMQLRKVCNHPYLFPGAEEGPPFKTDDNIIKDSGKMMILDKLLHRLRKDPVENNKVLIFSQMTRMLDILEDYLVYRGYKYFRIDGNTTGLERDTQMAQFNNPKSDYFVFLLSTRSGGLGINLQAANHVVLYDSDWNPQADLQAQDRAHRIGQKRPVRVYRFITDNTFEERIYRRALKKLYLDAMVVEQGRLAKQNSQCSKDELLSMIKFGAQDIFKSKGGDVENITEADIDALLATGEEKIKGMQAELAVNQQACLATFKLGVDETNVYEFEGINFQQGKNSVSKMIHLTLPEPMSEEDLVKECSKFGEVVKAVAHPNGTAALVTFRTQAGATDALNGVMWPAQYCQKVGETIVSAAMIDEGFDLGEYSKARRRGPVETVTQRQLDEMRMAPEKVPLKLPKKPSFPPHQLFNQKRILELYDIEVALLIQKWKKDCKRAQLEYQGVTHIPEEFLQEDNFDMTPEELQEREQLLNDGFPKWSHRDFAAFKKALVTSNPKDFAEIAKKMGTGKTEGEVRDYSHAFWTRGKELLGPVFEAVERRTAKIRERLKREQAVKDALRWKLEQYQNPYDELRLKQWKDPALDRLIFFTAYDNGMSCAQVPSKVCALPEAQFDIYYQTRSVQFYEAKVKSAVSTICGERKDHEMGGTGWRKRKREENPGESREKGGVSPGAPGAEDGGVSPGKEQEE